MPRANRHFVPNHVWHITHRCHNREFLLEKRESRREWISLLKTAKKRYETGVLGYSATCNHIHLVVHDPGIKYAIARSMQYTQGQTAQRYNERSDRLHSFWGGRYHATAVESGTHLLRCLVYVDLNMVRSGVIEHPSQWLECGYHDIQARHSRPTLIDRHLLAKLVGAQGLDELRELHGRAVESALERGQLRRDGRWTEPLAVGSRQYVESFAAALGKRFHGRQILEGSSDGTYLIAEPRAVYGDDMVLLEGDNTVGWLLESGHLRG